MKTNSKFILFMAGVFLASIAYIGVVTVADGLNPNPSTAVEYRRAQGENQQWTGVTRLDGEVLISGSIQYGYSAVSLTSPAVTFSVADKYPIIVLTADANLTAVRPTGGELYQEIIIMSGAGSNTIRFDDGANTALGANFTVTEGQGDVLKLLCTNASGNVWSKSGGNDN